MPAYTSNHSDDHQDDSSNNKRKRGLDALSIVLGKQNTEELEALRKEVKQLRILEALQIHTAATKDIHYWFDRINDPNDETSIETLMEMRDYIMEHSVLVDTREYNGIIMTQPFRFSTVGGCHELMASILFACVRYNISTVGIENTNISPASWQWGRSLMPARRCQGQCLDVRHIFLEDRATVAQTNYEHVKDFPTVLVEAAAKGEDPTAIAERRRTLRNMGGFHF